MINRCRGQKIRLSGFNNLTKSLSFNIYDICYARSKSSQNDYLEYIDEVYNSKKLRSILEEVTSMIQAQIINISTQDYDPRGASVVVLINEGHRVAFSGAAVTAHLDKSHITAHTYPETNPKTGISTFRADIEVATCGTISPLKALDFLIDSFDSDIVLMDYRVRGFTRDVGGRKVYMDHDITSIQDYISDEILRKYISYDINVVNDNMFHTKMVLKDFKLEEYLFGPELAAINSSTKTHLRKMLRREIQEIFECSNIYDEESPRLPRRSASRVSIYRCEVPHMKPPQPTTVKEFLNAHFGYFYTVRKVLRTQKTRFQKIALVDTPEFGRVLLLDGITQVVEKNEYQYHEPMVHGALCSHPKPERVLIVGGGDGGICREVLRHPTVKYVDFAEIDEGVIAFARAYLPTVHRRAFDDARVHIRISDGRTFVENHPRNYDVVIMDMTDPFGPSRYLYTREFFTAVKRSFRDKRGVFVMHSESPISRPDTFNLIQKTLRDVFGGVRTMYLYIQMYAVLWSISVCSDNPALLRMNAAVVQRRLREARIKRLKLFSGKTFDAMTVPFPYIEEILKRPGRVVTDRKPVFPDSIGKQTLRVSDIF